MKISMFKKFKNNNEKLDNYRYNTKIHVPLVTIKQGAKLGTKRLVYCSVQIRRQGKSFLSGSKRLSWRKSAYGSPLSMFHVSISHESDTLTYFKDNY